MCHQYIQNRETHSTRPELVNRELIEQLLKEGSNRQKIHLPIQINPLLLRIYRILNIHLILDHPFAVPLPV